MLNRNQGDEFELQAPEARMLLSAALVSAGVFAVDLDSLRTVMVIEVKHPVANQVTGVTALDVIFDSSEVTDSTFENVLDSRTVPPQGETGETAEESSRPTVSEPEERASPDSQEETNWFLCGQEGIERSNLHALAVEVKGDAISTGCHQQISPLL